MPHINVQLTKSPSAEQKAELAGRITKAVVEVLGPSAERVTVAFQEDASRSDDVRRQQQAVQQQ